MYYAAIDFKVLAFKNKASRTEFITSQPDTTPLPITSREVPAHLEIPVKPFNGERLMIVTTSEYATPGLVGEVKSAPPDAPEAIQSFYKYRHAKKSTVEI